MAMEWSSQEYFEEIERLVQGFCNGEPVFGTFEDYLDKAKEIREMWNFSKELVKEDNKEELSKIYDMVVKKFFYA